MDNKENQKKMGIDAPEKIFSPTIFSPKIYSQTTISHAARYLWQVAAGKKKNVKLPKPRLRKLKSKSSTHVDEIDKNENEFDVKKIAGEAYDREEAIHLLEKMNRRD